MAKIKVIGTDVTVISVDERDYISLTDMANAKEGGSRAADIIKNWLRTRYAIEFLSVWEQIHNPDFKVVESDHFKMQAGLTSFVLSASEWIEKTNAIGIIVKKGKNGKNLMKDSKSTIISGEKLKKSVKENVYYYISVDNINKVKSKEKILFKILS